MGAALICSQSGDKVDAYHGAAHEHTLSGLLPRRTRVLAVDGPANNAKGDKDAADWLPPNGPYDCKYVAKQIAISTKYELWVTPPERMEMTHDRWFLKRQR